MALLFVNPKFFDEDLARWGDHANVNIFDINDIPKEKLSEIVNGEGTIICAWCYSERSKNILKAMDLID